MQLVEISLHSAYAGIAIHYTLIGICLPVTSANWLVYSSTHWNRARQFLQFLARVGAIGEAYADTVVARGILAWVFVLIHCVMFGMVMSFLWLLLVIVFTSCKTKHYLISKASKYEYLLPPSISNLAFKLHLNI